MVFGPFGPQPWTGLQETFLASKGDSRRAEYIPNSRQHFPPVADDSDAEFPQVFRRGSARTSPLIAFSRGTPSEGGEFSRHQESRSDSIFATTPQSRSLALRQHLGAHLALRDCGATNAHLEDTAGFATF
jgi:hypothetical protein